ncbi:MAG: hypothetical protein R2838_08865 [Caldilineaceae bacterium]
MSLSDYLADARAQLDELCVAAIPASARCLNTGTTAGPRRRGWPRP